MKRGGVFGIHAECKARHEAPGTVRKTVIEPKHIDTLCGNERRDPSCAQAGRHGTSHARETQF
jgi:hypothetical protein